MLQKRTTRRGFLVGCSTAIASNLPAEIMMPALAVGNQQPSSLLGSREAVAMNNPLDFELIGHWRYVDQQRVALRQMYNGDSWLHQAGLQTLDAMDIIEASDPDDYTPENGAVYPGGEFGDNLQVVAQMIKLQLGLRAATVDLGGWDTHEYQAWDVEGYFASLLGELAQGLAALYADLDSGGNDNPVKSLTMVVQSEFGRRLRENAARGTDHGHGNVMLLLGGQVNGGQVYGNWPGLHTDQLYDHADLAVTTDYRRVLSEVLIRRLGNPHLGHIFPNYSDYAPMGIVQGEDITPIYGTDLQPSSYLPFIRR